MSNMSKLTLVTLKARTSTPQEHRRTALLAKLEEQLGLAEAEVAGRKHLVMKRAYSRDSDGNRTMTEREKRIKAWWWRDGDALAMVVRYGAKPIEFAKGKRALRVENVAAVPAAIRTVMEAVRAGELDSAMEAVVSASKGKGGKG